MNHLKDEEIISYYNHKLEQNEEMNLIEHVAGCTECAERFANLFPVEELIEPTDNLQNEIEAKLNDEKYQKRVKTSGEKHESKAKIIPLTKYKSKKTEWFSYSSKVVVAAGIAVLMVFNMDSIKPNLIGTKIETMKQLNNKFSISRMLQQSTEKIGAGMKNISGGIAENLEFDKGVYNDEKTKK
ncbi:hypothetical protein [Eubacterium sp. CAG:156]|uniref:hypothetical protein n=1 Tax=Eubacterium sp. CAG:156 TaxID=1262880 RepID=UPI000336F773|nr:putative uncharacterized protein [Eubacterium sp. CAG:156]